MAARGQVPPPPAQCRTRPQAIQLCLRVLKKKRRPRPERGLRDPSGVLLGRSNMVDLGCDAEFHQLPGSNRATRYHLNHFTGEAGSLLHDSGWLCRGLGVGSMMLPNFQIVAFTRSRRAIVMASEAWSRDFGQPPFAGEFHPHGLLKAFSPQGKRATYPVCSRHAYSALARRG